MTRAVFLAIVTAFVLMDVPFIAWGHGHYTDWKIPGTSMSCCNQYDCKEVRWRIGTGKIELELDGQWIVPPPEAMLELPSNDGTAHACWTRRWGLSGQQELPRPHCWQQPGGSS